MQLSKKDESELMQSVTTAAALLACAKHEDDRYLYRALLLMGLDLLLMYTLKLPADEPQSDALKRRNKIKSAIGNWEACNNQTIATLVQELDKVNLTTSL